MNWHLLWLLWAGISLASFGAFELYAVFTGHPEHKLSNAFWTLQDSLPNPTVWRVIIFMFLCYLAFHLTFGPRH